MSADKELESYFQEAATWDMDREAMNARSTRIAWRVTAALTLALLVSLVALIVLLPLKTVEPFVVRVDGSTGVVDVVPMYTGNATLDETTTRHLLKQYVMRCERFVLALAEMDYWYCGAFQAPMLAQAWGQLWERTNPNSPLNLYKDGRTVLAQVQSLTFFKRTSGGTDLAQIRYLKIERQGTAADKVSHWIATLQYGIGKPSTDPQQRDLNPFGLKLLEFKPEREMASAAMTLPEVQP